MKMRFSFTLLSLGTLLSFPHASQATSLQQAVQRTVESNPEFLVKSAQDKQNKQRVWKSIGEFLPTIEASTSDGPEDSLNFSTNRQWVSLHRYDTDLSLTENVFNGGRSFYGIKENQERVNSAGSSMNLTAQDLALSAISAYLSTLKNQKLITISENNVKIYRSTFIIIGKRAHIGVSSVSERQLAEGRLSVAEADYYDQVKRQLDTIAIYVKVIGEPPEQLHLPKSKIPYSDVSLAQAIKTALKNNPNLQKAKYDVNVTLNAYKANRATFYPSVDMVLRRYRGKNIAGIEGPAYNNSALVRLTWNLFRGGSDVAVLKESAYRKVEAQDEAMRLQREVIEKTVTSYNQLHNLLTTLPKYKNHMENSLAVVKAYREQYVAGKRTLFDVLNAESELYNARQKYVSVKYDIFTAKYSLLNRMGLLLYALHVKNPFQQKLIKPNESEKYKGNKKTTLIHAEEVSLPSPKKTKIQASEKSETELQLPPPGSESGTSFGVTTIKVPKTKTLYKNPEKATKEYKVPLNEQYLLPYSPKKLPVCPYPTPKSLEQSSTKRIRRATEVIVLNSEKIITLPSPAKTEIFVSGKQEVALALPTEKINLSFKKDKWKNTHKHSTKKYGILLNKIGLPSYSFKAPVSSDEKIILAKRTTSIKEVVILHKTGETTLLSPVNTNKIIPKKEKIISEKLIPVIQ